MQQICRSLLLISVNDCQFSIASQTFCISQRVSIAKLQKDKNPHISRAKSRFFTFFLQKRIKLQKFAGLYCKFPTFQQFKNLQSTNILHIFHANYSNFVRSFCKNVPNYIPHEIIFRQVYLIYLQSKLIFCTSFKQIIHISYVFSAKTYQTKYPTKCFFVRYT